MLWARGLLNSRMETTNTTAEGRKTITMATFFALPEVVALQEVQRANEYGSAEHRAAYERIVRVAGGYLAQGRGELVSAATYFGDY